MGHRKDVESVHISGKCGFAQLTTERELESDGDVWICNVHYRIALKNITVETLPGSW